MIPQDTKNTRVLLAMLCLPLLGLAARPLFADGGEEILAAHPMPLYKDSVPAADNRLNRLTKNDLGTVRKFFEANLKPGDRIETFSKDDETGFNVIYTKKTGSRELKAFELRVTARSGKRPPHTAFGELFGQVSFGRHKESELKALQKEYGDIDLAYFRGNEDKLIAERASREAHPDQDTLKAAGKKNKVSAEDKAEAKELKRKMKELKAQGDFAGMMALAQSSKKFQAPPSNQMEAARLAAEDRSRDTWDIWVRCLKETKAAAYRTRLEYSSDALPD
ncbi:MAG: hypothetical protein WC943_00600 [Elusimicrobiota bacterium]|jgi:hypothetical protein